MLRAVARRWVAVSALVAALVPSSATAATPPPSLGEWTTISATATAWVRVRLAHPVAFHSESGRELARPSVRFTGGAFGYVLYGDSDARADPYVGFFRMPSAEGGSVQFSFGGADPRTGKAVVDNYVLPAGTYRLALITDGKGSARFRLPATRGAERKFGATTRLRHRAFRADVPTVGGVGPPTFATGDSFDSPYGVRVFRFDWVRTAVQASAVYGDCHYGGAPPAGAWVPGCPGGDSVLTAVHGVLMGCCGTAYGSYWLPGGRHSFGVWYATAGAVARGGVFLVWVPAR